MTQKLDSLVKKYFSSYLEHSFGFNNKEHYHKGYTEGVKKAFEIMNSEIPPILSQIEDDFRKHLGVSNN